MALNEDATELVRLLDQLSLKLNQAATSGERAQRGFGTGAGTGFGDTATTGNPMAGGGRGPQYHGTNSIVGAGMIAHHSREAFNSKGTSWTTIGYVPGGEAGPTGKPGFPKHWNPFGESDPGGYAYGGSYYGRYGYAAQARAIGVNPWGLNAAALEAQAAAQANLLLPHWTPPGMAGIIEKDLNRAYNASISGMQRFASGTRAYLASGGASLTPSVWLDDMVGGFRDLGRDMAMGLGTEARKQAPALDKAARLARQKHALRRLHKFERGIHRAASVALAYSAIEGAYETSLIRAETDAFMSEEDKIHAENRAANDRTNAYLSNAANTLMVASMVVPHPYVKAAALIAYGVSESVKYFQTDWAKEAEKKSIEKLIKEYDIRMPNATYAARGRGRTPEDRALFLMAEYDKEGELKRKIQQSLEAEKEGYEQIRVGNFREGSRTLLKAAQNVPEASFGQFWNNPGVVFSMLDQAAQGKRCFARTQMARAGNRTGD